MAIALAVLGELGKLLVLHGKSLSALRCLSAGTVRYSSLGHRKRVVRMSYHLHKEPERVNPIDAAVGARIRMLRLEHNMTLDQFAAELGMDAHSLMRVESGTERGSASLLFRLTSRLEVPIVYFFQ